MSQQESRVSPIPFEEGFQGELLTAECSRQAFLKPGAFSDMVDVPHYITDILRYFAGNSLVKGLAVIAEVESNGFLMKVFKESLSKETERYRAADAVRATILAIKNGAMESVYMEGRTFEESEKEVRQYALETPGIILVGVIKFTD